MISAGENWRDFKAGDLAWIKEGCAKFCFVPGTGNNLRANEEKIVCLIVRPPRFKQQAIMEIVEILIDNEIRLIHPRYLTSQNDE